MYGHLGQWTVTILAIFCSPELTRLHMKFEQNCGSAASEELLENVDGRTDGRIDDDIKSVI